MPSLYLTSDVPLLITGQTQSSYDNTYLQSVNDPFVFKIETAEFTIPFTCGVESTDPNNSCNHLTPTTGLWSFNMPFSGGQIIGTLTDDGQYQVFVGYWAINVTVNSIFSSQTMPITVTYNRKALTPPNTVFLISTKDTVEISASWPKYGLETTSNAVQPVAIVYSASIIGPLTTKTVYYCTSKFQSKQCFVVTTESNETTLTQLDVKIDPPDNYLNLGFSYEAFNYPPYIGEGASLGFYTGSDSIQEHTFQPAAPFQITQVTSNPLNTVVLTACLSTIQTPANSPAPAPACPDISKNLSFAVISTSEISSETPCFYCFQTDEFSQTQHLALLDPLSLTGWYPLEITGTTPEDYGLSVVTNTDLSKLNSKWAIFQVWGGSTSTSTAYSTASVSLVCKYTPPGGTEVYLTLDGSRCTGTSGTTYLFSTFDDLTINTPIGFIPYTLDSTLFSLLLSTKLDTTYLNAYAINCWTGFPPLALTDAGAFCNDAASIQSYKNGQKLFIQESCNGVYNEDCPNSGGVHPDSCSGWLQGTIAQFCQTACKSSSLSIFCDQSKLAYCNLDGKRANTAECACLNVYTSSFKVSHRSNLSYVDYVAYLNQNYGLNANTDLNPQCWWDTCTTTDYGGITLSSTTLSCPTNENSCFNIIKGLEVSNDSSVILNLKNECKNSSTQDSSNFLDNPCTSMSNIINSINQSPNESSDWVYPNQIDPNLMTITDKILLYGMGGITALVILSTTLLVLIKFFRFCNLNK
jgi:hypothetical protein